METNVNYTIVGTFVILLLSACILTIIWLSSGFRFAEFTTYELFMQESVTGLNIDSPVEYNGVNVGSVKSIELDKKNPHLVQVFLDIKTNTPITVGTVATLATRGVTGITYIALKDKSIDMTPLTRHHGEKYPVIQTAPSIFTRLDTALTRLSDNIQKVADSVEELLNQENLDSIQQSLSNLKKITNNLAENGKKFDKIIANTAQASAEFKPLLLQTSSAMRSFESQTLPSAQRMLSNMDAAARAINRFTNEVQRNPSVLIRGTAPLPPGPGEK